MNKVAQGNICSFRKSGLVSNIKANCSFVCIDAAQCSTPIIFKNNLPFMHAFMSLQILVVRVLILIVLIAGYRAFILRMMYGVYYSILAPLIVMYNSSEVLRKAKKMFSSIVSFVYTSNHVQSFHA